jgi:hypothetical protein
LVEFVLYNHREIEQAIIKARLDTYGRTASTEKEALRNLTPLRSVRLNNTRSLKRPELWLKWREKFLDNIEGVQADIVKSRYEDNQPYQIFCLENNISQTTYQNLLKDVRSFGIMIAIEMGLIFVTKEKE